MIDFGRNFFVQVFFTYDSELNPGVCSEVFFTKSGEELEYKGCNLCIQNLYKKIADCQNSCQNGQTKSSLRWKRGRNSQKIETSLTKDLFSENENLSMYKRTDPVESSPTKTTTTPTTSTTNNNNFMVQNSNEGIWNDECYDASGESSSDSGSLSGSRPRIDSDELSEIVQQPSSGSDTDSDFVHYKPSYRAYRKNRAGYKQMMKDGSFDGMVKRSPKMFTRRLRL